jgi:hypothetical protein
MEQKLAATNLLFDKGFSFVVKAVELEQASLR